jgi:hypothetical protein
MLEHSLFDTMKKKLNSAGLKLQPDFLSCQALLHEDWLRKGALQDIECCSMWLIPLECEWHG